ncbi:MAG: Methyl-directed repair adenine methylase [Myxococcaceae bacterium]|nr:Methyl-directed repair adenine methylase [Myxococcaceae bacterium]
MQAQTHPSVAHATHASARVEARETTRAQKPFLKWVGGKGRLVHVLEAMLPPGVEHMRHVEPFMGGAALFFSRAPQRALLCDLNTDLVSAFCAVRDHVELVLQHLIGLASSHDEHQFYRVRAVYNKRAHSTPAERAALFIYLNKTCFNGLYRVNQSGHFNAPAGRYTNPAIADSTRLHAAGRCLHHVDVRCAPFEELLSSVRPGDFVYLDPPYEPLSSTANFTAYSRHGFTRDDQARLRDVFRELDRRGAKLMLSNSDVALIHEFYRGFRVDRIQARRGVNCDPTKRGVVSELVIRNY